MKARQVVATDAVFALPSERKGGRCAYPQCGANIPDYKGTHVGGLVYCNYEHFSLHVFEEDDDERSE